MDELQLKLCAYIAAFKATGRYGINNETTYGQIVADTIREVRQAEQEGTVNIRVMEFERDPDAD